MLVWEKSKSKKISYLRATELMYLLMGVDGFVTEQEKTIFYDYIRNNDIADNSCWSEKEFINDMVNKELSKEDIYKSVIKYVDEKLSDGFNEMYMYISSEGKPGCELIWNMMLLSIADKSYDQNKVKYIKYIADKLEIDDNLYMEMNNALTALYSIEVEMELIKDLKYVYRYRDLKQRKKIIKNTMEYLIKEYYA